MKKLLCFLFCLVMAVSVLTACAPEHEHTFDTIWMNDEEYHWHQATCEHTEEVSDRAAHEDTNGDDICDVCGYIANHVHSYDTAWSWNETTHYHKNSCGHADEEKYRSDIADHVDANQDGACDVCTYNYGHTHTYDEAWTPADNPEEGHWHAANCCHKVAGTDLAPHVDEDNNSSCDVCAWDYAHEHTYAEEFSTNDDEHWREVTCGHDIPAGEKNVHKDEMAGDVPGQDGICDTCGFESAHFHTYSDKWSSDDEQHWYELSCHPELGLKADAAAHEGFEEDGICDICSHVVFGMYNITVECPDDVAIVDENNEPLTVPFVVKEGNELVFYVRLNNNQRLEEIKGAVWDATPSDSIEVTEGGGKVTYYLHKVTLTPEEDTAIVLTINNLKTFETIVNGEALTFQAPKSSYQYAKITFNAPEAGNYVIMALNDDHGELRFTAVGSEDYQSTYQFKVSKAGSFTVQSRYFVWEGNKQYTPKYYILRLEDDIVLPHVEGSGYTLPTNTDVVVTFTMPSAGLYHISSTNAVNANTFTWNGAVGNLLVNASYAGEVITLSIRNNIENAVSFEFDWKIIKLEPEGTLSLNKDNPVDVNIGYYHTYSFTASKSGTYSFAVGKAETLLYRYYNAWASTTTPVYREPNKTYTFQSYYSQNYEFIAPVGTEISINGGGWRSGHVIKYLAEGTVVEYKVRYTGAEKSDPIKVIVCAYNPQMSRLNTVSLAAGETIHVYTVDNQSLQNPAAEPFTDTVSIKYLGYNAQTDSQGNPYLVPGVEWVYTAFAAGDYSFTPSAGAQISVDGGKTWQNSITKTLKSGATVSLMIKNKDGSAAEAKVTIVKAVYEHTLTLGENSYSFVPGKDYAVTLTGSDSPDKKLPYTLSWTDSNIVVTYNGTAITSGKDIDYDPLSDKIVIRYNGTAQAEVKLTLADRYVAEDYEKELVVGSTNKITLRPYAEYTFILTGGEGVQGPYDRVPTYNYKLSWTNTNVKLYTVNEDDDLVELKNGHTFFDYQNGLFTTPVIVVYEGSAAAEVQFTLVENNPVQLGELVEGDNPVALEPGKSYTFSLPENLWVDYSNHYTLTWNNTNVTVDLGGVIAVSGTECVVGYCEGVLTYTGTESTNMTLTVALPKEDLSGIEADISGVGTFELIVTDGYDGNSFTFLVLESGSYKLTDGGGEQTIYMLGCSLNEDLTGELNETFYNLIAGQVITLNIGTDSGEDGTVKLVVTKL